MGSGEIQSNQKRCKEILECKSQIDFWKSKLEVLEAEQEECIKLARLRLDAPGTWRCLGRKERTEKKFILAALESQQVPAALDDLPAFPPQIRFDRDILLARVARDDFAAKYADERLFVPPKLRGDKEVILAIIPKHPQVIETMACELRDDQEILDAVLAQTNLPPHFLQHFSERVRNNARLMLQVMAHPQGLSSMVFCSPELRNDKDFVLQAIQCGNHQSASSHVLRYTSHRLRDDRDVVLAAVSQCGINLKYASYAFRRDKEVVLAASRENGRAFRYCLPGEVKDSLMEDRNFILQIAQCTPNNVLKFCMERFKEDREVLLQALVHGLEWSYVPDMYQDNVDFILEAVQRKPQIYMDLPEHQRENYEIALAVIQAIKEYESADDVILEATENCPQILANPDAVMSIVKNFYTEVLPETIQFSPMEIRSNKEIMLQAVKTDSTAYEFCSEELQNDIDIVMEAIPACLYLVHDTYQLRHPEVIIAAIEKTEPGHLWTTFEDTYEPLWHNRDVALAWLNKGGDWLGDDFPEEFSNDEELILTVVKHNWKEFCNASDELLCDKQFLMKAIAIDGRIMSELDDDLRYDFDLALVAFSHDERAIQFYSGAEHFAFMVDFTESVRAELEEYDTFHNIVMGQIMTSKPSTTGEVQCPLSMLNQGTETVGFYQEKLSSYLDLVRGEELQELRMASKNLLAWGF